MLCKTRGCFLMLCGLALPLVLSSQAIDSTADTPGLSDRSRSLLTIGAHSVLLPSSFAVLDHYWYKGYGERSFHFANDFDNWNYMDKAGHLWAAYNLTRVSSRSWRWAGMSSGRADVTGAAIAFAYQTVIETADGLSSKWGFSLGDFAANITGVGIYSVQQLIWKEQKVEVKVMAYRPYRYPASLADRAKELYGKSLVNHLLSDYNIQSYWMSTSIQSFFPGSKIPGWLGFSIGYGARGMLGERNNQWFNQDGHWISRTDIGRRRRLFLAPDLILTRIPARSAWLKRVLWVMGAVKIPAPTLEFSNGRFRAHVFMLN